MEQCWNCPSNYIIPDKEGNHICHKCGAFTFVAMEFPMPFDIVKAKNAVGVRRRMIDTECVICHLIFKAYDHGKMTQNTCSEECKKERINRYQQARRDAIRGDAKMICKKCGKPFPSRHRVYCPECSEGMNWSKQGRPKIQLQMGG